MFEKERANNILLVMTCSNYLPPCDNFSFDLQVIFNYESLQPLLCYRTSPTEYTSFFQC